MPRTFVFMNELFFLSELEKEREKIEKLREVMKIACQSNEDLAKTLGVDVKEIPKICGSKCTKKYYPLIELEKKMDMVNCEPDELHTHEDDEYFSAMAHIKLRKIVQYKLNLS